MKMKKFTEEFKAFIAKGNVIDMSVAVIVGGAFSKIVTSLVNDVIMPLVGMVVGKISVSDMKWVIAPAEYDEAGVETVAEVALRYGIFIQTIIDFLIIALCVFVMLKIVLGTKEKLESMKKKEEEAAEAAAAEEAAAAPAEPPKPTTEDLLTEIRDLLKNK